VTGVTDVSRRPAGPVDPIAVIGIGCRFPMASGPAAFWDLLAGGVDAIREMPPDRFDTAVPDDRQPKMAGWMRTRRRGFLDEVDRFDAAFFAISPREAELMDPQQRLLLEVGWEALEDAGQVPARLAGSDTGVFVGLWINDYEARMARDPERIEFAMTTGTGRYAASGRLSHVLGVHGPSLTIDTACSSSLVAVHLACQSLWIAECDCAIAAGANVILEPAVSVAYSRSRMLSPDGRSKFGDARADGYVRSEGAGAVVLKRLSRALADGDPVRAVILGTAANNDGRTGRSLGTPGQAGQEDLLRKAYRRAGVSPANVQYVEAHGTGTRAGDPVELQALGAVLGAGRPAGARCAVGSVKTNIGHTEGAAGIAGFIKVALALEHRAIPPSLHFETPSPDIPWNELPLRIPTALEPWPDADRALAGVSAFGIAGTNAHVVVGAAPARQEPAGPADGRAHVLVLSGATRPALDAVVEAYERDLGRADAAPIADVCYTAACRRAQHAERVAVVGRTREQLRDALASLRAGAPLAGRARRHGARRIAFVFSGQGSQWLGMGRRVLDQEPAVRSALVRCDEAIRAHAGWSVLAELHAGAERSRLADIDVVQPVLFAMQVALAALWRAWGIEPDAVIGHSMGEVAAAHVAGALTLDDAARVISHRSRLMRRTSGRGAMATVELSVPDARRALAGIEHLVSIAASNSSRSTVLSGDVVAVDALVRGFQAKDIFCRRVNVDVASHGPQMEPLRDELRVALAGLAPATGVVPLYSTVTGARIEGTALGAEYWTRNLRETVLFSTAVERARDDGHDVFIEISPHPILLPSIEHDVTEGGPDVVALPSGRRDDDERSVMLDSLGALWSAGHPVSFERLYPSGGRHAELPAYPWQRERFWFADPGVPASRQLGEAVELADAPGRFVWDVEIDAASRAGTAAFLPLAVTAASRVLGDRRVVLSDIELVRPQSFDPSTSPRVQIVADTSSGGTVCIYGRADDEWTLHATASMCRARDCAAVERPMVASLDEALARCRAEVSGENLYRRLAETGIEIQPECRRIAVAHTGCDELMASVDDGPSTGATGALASGLDACLQTAVAAVLCCTGDPRNAAVVPVHVDEVRVHGVDATVSQVHATVRRGGTDDGGSVRVDAAGLAPDGTLVLHVIGVHLRRRPAGAARTAVRPIHDWLHEIAWRPAEPARAASAAAAVRDTGDEGWVVLADGSGVGAALAARLAARGATCLLVRPRGGADPADATIAPDSRDDLERFLDQRLDARTAWRFVHLWGLEATTNADAPSTSFETAEAIGCRSALVLVQALARRHWRAAPRLWLVTRGAQPAGAPGPLSLGQAPLWGMGRVIAEEQADLWGGVVDLDPLASSEDAAASLLEVLDDRGPDDQLALRRGQRYVPRMTGLERSPARPVRWRADATYLVTGGLGSLGVTVARWMARHGARRLVILGRTALPPRDRWATVAPGAVADRVRAIRDLEGLGLSIQYAAVDVAEEAELAAFLARFRAEGWPPIRGVLHAAGVIEGGFLVELTPAALSAVLRPKVLGSWLLHRLLRDEPLDVFVLFSSIASIWGQPGQANYAAANAFLDALAHHRRALGLPACAINWGVWRDSGLAVTGGGQLVEYLEARGAESFTPAEGLEALRLVLGGGRTQTAVLPIDWTRFREHDVNRSWRLASDLLARPDARPDAPPALDAPPVSFRAALVDTEPRQRRLVLEQRLTEELGAVLKLAPARIERDQPLGGLGLSSLLGLELRRRLERMLDLKLSATLVWNHPTIADLATHLAAKLEVPLDAPVVRPTTSGETAGSLELAATVSEIGALSDDEALRLLMKGSG
jgi:myxalamid-type polyketide synthase MxaE and MxaD